jgi:hypothetical protein
VSSVAAATSHVPASATLKEKLDDLTAGHPGASASTNHVTGPEESTRWISVDSVVAMIEGLSPPVPAHTLYAIAPVTLSHSNSTRGARFEAPFRGSLSVGPDDGQVPVCLIVNVWLADDTGGQSGYCASTRHEIDPLGSATRAAVAGVFSTTISSCPSIDTTTRYEMAPAAACHERPTGDVRFCVPFAGEVSTGGVVGQVPVPPIEKNERADMSLSQLGTSATTCHAKTPSGRTSSRLVVFPPTD